MASVLYVTNNTALTVGTGANITPSSIIHRNCQSQANLENGNIVIKGMGYFNIDVTLTFSSASTGTVKVALYKDSNAIDGATSSTTISTASTEVRSLSFSCEILNNCKCSISTISLTNLGIPITTSNVAIRVKRDS